MKLGVCEIQRSGIFWARLKGRLANLAWVLSSVRALWGMRFPPGTTFKLAAPAFSVLDGALLPSAVAFMYLIKSSLSSGFSLFLDASSCSSCGFARSSR